MAIGLKSKSAATQRCKVVVLSSDGEQNEGSHWEAVMEAGFKKMGNLCLVIDRNEMQLSGKVSEVLNTEPLVEKYHSFGWEAYQADGHDYASLLSGFSRFNEEKDRPKVVVCRTTRGKGVSFMEQQNRYHSCTLTEDEYQRAIEELS
jgi:transketolase